MHRTLFILLILAFPSWAFADAGEIRFVQGDVRIQQANGTIATAKRSDKIAEGDTIITGPASYAQLAMRDEAILAVRPDTQIKIETYRFSGKEDGNEKGIIGLLRGGFRTITGWIGRQNKDAYLVRTPTATIGIRGTDHEPLYIPQPAPGQTPLAEPGTYNKVNVGETVIRTASGRIELSANQAGFASVQPGSAPVRLAQIPAFMRNTPVIRQDDRQAKPDAQSTPQSPTEGASPPAPPPPPPPPSPSSTTDSTVGTLSLPPPPTLAPLPQPGTVDPRYLPADSTVAPDGFVVAGGDLSPGVFLGHGSGYVGNPQEGMAILLDSAGNPIRVGANGGFNYDRASAPLIDSGDTSVDGKTVRWGIYAGGVINDYNGLRYPQYFFFMGGGQATTPANLLAAMPNPGNAISFSSVGGFTKPINDNGMVGGSVNSVFVELKNLSGSINVYSYALSLTDAQARIWSASLVSPQLLSNFISGGINVNLSVSCSGCSQTTGTGSASGMVIGNSNPSGFISSYSMKAGGSGVAGTVLAR